MRLLGLWISLMVVSAATGGQRAETINGEEIDGQLLAVRGDTVRMQTDAGERKLNRADVATLTVSESVPADLMAAKGRRVVETVAGDRLVVEAVELADGRWKLTSPHLGTIEAPMAAVRACYLPAADQTPAEVRSLCETMKLLEGSQDRLLILGADHKALSAVGAIRSISVGAKPSGGVIRFTWQEQDRTVAAEKARAVLLAGGQGDQAPAGQLLCVDGSTLRFRQIEIDGADVRVTSAELGTVRLSRDSLVFVQFHSDRVVYLGELTPVDVKEHGLLGWRFEHRRDASAAGGPLKLDGRVYQRGLGLHSFCELTYDLAGRFEFLVAMVGIDDAARPNGDATVTVLGDGRDLTGPLRLSGKDAAKRLRLDVKGIARLTIRVDFGQDELDVGDHVDFADARLVRAPGAAVP